MRASASLDGADARGGEGLLGGQEFGVFAGEDVVGDSREVVFLAQGEAEGEHEGGLAGADGAGEALAATSSLGFGWGEGV